MDASHLIFPIEIFKDFNKVFLKNKNKNKQTKKKNHGQKQTLEKNSREIISKVDKSNH